MHVCTCARFIVHRCIDTTASIGSGANSHSVAPRVAMRGGRNGVAVFHGEHLADRHFAPISSEEKENKQKQTKRKKTNKRIAILYKSGGGKPVEASSHHPSTNVDISFTFVWKPLLTFAWKPLLTTPPPTSTSLSLLCVLIRLCHANDTCLESQHTQTHTHIETKKKEKTKGADR